MSEPRRWMSKLSADPDQGAGAILQSCKHAIMQSWNHAIMQSCNHAIMQSCYRVEAKRRSWPTRRDNHATM